jgi:ribosomal protein S18 acetylase RimI-like enzyme
MDPFAFYSLSHFQTLTERSRSQLLQELSGLVNSAYRGPSSRQGWTTEADWLDGQRTDPKTLADELSQPGVEMWVLVAPDSFDILGCVRLESTANVLEIGMLTVRPGYQGRGLGRKILLFVEELAQERRIGKLKMFVLSLRTELISWYERQGYHETADTKAFPEHDIRFGLPRVSGLFFKVLEKRL